MLRFALTAVCVGLTAWAAFAEDPPKGGGQIRTLRVTAEGDKMLVTTRSEWTQRMALTDRTGGEEKEKVVEVKSRIVDTRGIELKYLRASDADDKDIPAADFKDRFQKEGYVVWLDSPLDPTWKKRFRSDTVFVEYRVPAAEKPPEKKPDGK